MLQISPPEENHVGEAVEPAVDNQELHCDLIATEEFHLSLRILPGLKADVEEAAGGESCVES